MNELILQTTGNSEGRGRPAAALESLLVLDVQDLRPEDLLDATRIFAQPREPQIGALRQSHHEVARLLAAGHKNIEVARLTGKCAQTISNLLRNPMFQELLAHYQDQRTEEVFEFTTRIETAASDALEALAQRLGDEVDEVKTSVLLKATTDLLDRAGHSPVSRRENKNFNIGLTGEDIRAIKAEARGQILDLKAEEVDPGS